MKKLFLSILISICLVTTGFAASKTYTKGTLTGGTSGCLDEIDGADLSDGDRALVISSTYGYMYYLDATSGVAESSPDVIAPDSSAGDKRWILKDPSNITSDLSYMVTTMTAAGINAAIVSANAAGGGVVYLSSGTYDCTGATQVTLLDNVDIVGYGAILQGDGGLTHVVYGSSINDVHIYGLEIDGQFTGTLNLAVGEKGLAIATGDNVTIQDCYIHNFQSRAIEAADLTDSSFINNHIESAGMGIRIISDASDLNFVDNHIEDVYAGGITLACDVGESIINVNINGNLIDTTAAGETLLAQNIVCYSAYSGAAHGTISGFNISNNTLIGKDHGCIRLGGDNHIIANNTCDGSEIRIALTNDGANRHESSHITIEGNTIWGIDDDTVIDDGILVRDGAFIDIVNNTITGSSGSGCGILLAYTDVGSVQGNTIQTVGEDGILFQDCTKILCTDNTISAAGTGDTGYGIHLNNAIDDENENITVTQNHIFNCLDGNIVNTSAGVNHKFSNNGGNDIDLYSNWTNSYIVNKKGTLSLFSNVTDIGVALIPDSSTVLYWDNAAIFRTLEFGTRTVGSTSMAERASAPLDYADHGQFWVKTGAPNTPWFTDEDGTDVQLGVSGGADLVNDTLPHLGGDLQSNTFNIDIADDTGTKNRVYYGSSGDMYWAYNGTGDYLTLQGSDGGVLAKFEKNGASFLYYDDAIKLKADSFGIDIVDELRMRDDLNLYFGSSDDVMLRYDEAGSDIFEMTDAGGAAFLTAYTLDGNSYVSLGYEGIDKLRTSSVGVELSDELTLDDGNKIYFGDGNDLEMWHSGTHGFIGNTTGNLYLYATGTSSALSAVPNGATSLFHSGNAKLATTAIGVTVTGTVTATCGVLTCNADYIFDEDYDLMSLDNLQKYIDKNNHLPDMTINDIKEGELIDYNQAITELLIKTEEQALYILQLHHQLTFYKYMAFFFMLFIFLFFLSQHRRIAKLESK